MFSANGGFNTDIPPMCSVVLLGIYWWVRVFFANNLNGGNHLKRNCEDLWNNLPLDIGRDVKISNMTGRAVLRYLRPAGY